MGATGAFLLLTLAVVALLAPVIATHDPLVQAGLDRLQGPSVEHLFGTDNLGRDVFSRVVFGSRISLFVGLLSVALASVAGTVVGITSAYLGGKFDLIVQRLVDAFLGFPSLVLTLALVIALSGSLLTVTLAISISFLPRVVRIARSQALSVKEEVYVRAARALGVSGTRIVLLHIAPNCLAPVFVVSTGLLGTAVITEASLSFLGLGVPPPNPSWGGMIQQGARGYLEAAPWLAVMPGIALSMIVFSFAFLGDALRDSLDPRLRGR